MPIRKINEDIYSVGAIDWDRTLFDALIPLPGGTSYNCYLIKGVREVALVDTVEPEKGAELLANLAKLAIERLDYVVVNHAEQDHSGTLPGILNKYPGACIITNNKCKELLHDLLHISDDKFRVIGDGESLDLGGKTLQFIFTPWVHWPETMVTFLSEHKILFSCDLFGSHLATSDLYAVDRPQVYESARQYYAEIMMPYRSQIKKHLTKIHPLGVKMIAPSHGPVYSEPDFILNAYADWISDEVKNRVVIPYVSMHGSTEKMVLFLVDRLLEKGVAALPLNLTCTDFSRLTVSLVDAATLVIASPVVHGGPHPLVAGAVSLISSLKPKMRYLSIIGSYSWGGKLEKQIQEMMAGLKAEFLQPVIIKGLPRQENFAELEQLAQEIASKHDGLAIRN